MVEWYHISRCNLYPLPQVIAMNIEKLILDFVKRTKRRKSAPYHKICEALLTGGRPYSLNAQPGYWESEYLPSNIRSSVMAYSSNKDTAIALYRDLTAFLAEKGAAVPPIEFPPIPVSNTFERLMFIAKYLQDEDHRISDLSKKLWISERTIEEDMKRLRDDVDPIQVCGKKFFIPDTERRDGGIRFASTAHPIFLAETLTQVLVMLKGLRVMAEDPLYAPYALQTGSEIWNQLSAYAKDRIRFVLQDLMPEDLSWYEKLAKSNDDHYFHTETACSQIYNTGSHVILDCMKNRKSFCVEYEEDGKISVYSDCRMERNTFSDNPPGMIVNCSGGRIRLLLDHVIRSAYTMEELAAN